jgi:cell division protease FtsH
MMFKNIMLMFIIAVSMMMLFSYVNSDKKPRKDISYSEFIQEVTGDNVATVMIKEQAITGEFKGEGGQFETYAPDDAALVPLLSEHNVKIFAKPPDTSPWYLQALITWLPIVVLIAIWIFFMRQMQGGGGNKAFSFGKSRAKLLIQDEHKVTFKDVAGVEEAKEELVEIIEFLKDPQKFQRLGGKIPKGVLLVGSPGTGKTLLAKAVAGEAGVSFFSISGSDFVEMFVGVGAARVRDLFEQGKKSAPCIIFMDEIDAVGRHRGAGLGGGHDEREQTLNALLVEMDGFESSEGVILIAATNRPDVLDPALLRPGRFDRQVIVPVPDLQGRHAILKVHTEKTPLSQDVDLLVLAKGTPGFAGAELANLVNEAALIAARKNKECIDNLDIEEAKDKVMMGKERRSMTISEEQKKITAYHESGHAIVAKMLKESDPIHKVSIIPRGMALGVTVSLPGDDRHTYSKSYLSTLITVSMGGRAAESIVFNHFTSGASSDIKHATAIARNMVTAYGMSDKLGPLSYNKSDSVFLGRDLTVSKEFSEETAVLIDKEMRKIVEECYETALGILKENTVLLEKMAELLLENETITSDEIKELIAQYTDEKWKAIAAENLAVQKAEAEVALQTTPANA